MCHININMIEIYKELINIRKQNIGVVRNNNKFLLIDMYYYYFYDILIINTFQIYKSD